MRLLLIEDDLRLAEMLAADLGRVGHHITIIDTGQAAIALIARDSFDGIVVDRRLTGAMNGVSVIRWLRDAKVAIPIVMLTAYGSLDEKIEGLDAGADDYLVKPIDAIELDARFRAILRRPTQATSTGTIRAGDIEISVAQHRVRRAGRAIDVPNFEFKLLTELVRGADGVMSRAYLLEKVWGFDFDPKTKIVESYVKRLRDTLTSCGDPDPIETVRGVGYMIRS